MPKVIIPELCPYCNIQPMIWTTPKGSWYLACKNICKPWHPKVYGRSISDRLRAIHDWNDKANALAEFGAYNLDFKERELLPSDPEWIGIKDTFYFKCSNCGYELAPKLPTCPSCKKRMRID